MNVSPGPSDRTVRDERGRTLAVPDDWSLLPPGDAAATRRVKAAGDHYVVQEQKGRRTFSKGVWAPAETIREVQEALATERASPAHAKKQAAAVKRRARKQTEYVEDFTAAVLAFLNFDAAHAEDAGKLAKLVAAHATPVGSGTVARTQRIPVERRAEAAVIAWLRHQTTGYDDMTIARVKGKRREVRRELAARSKQLLAKYRTPEPPRSDCPLQAALRLKAD